MLSSEKSNGDRFDIGGWAGINKQVPLFSVSLLIPLLSQIQVNNYCMKISTDKFSQVWYVIYNSKSN